MAQLVVSVREDENHNLEAQAPPVIDKNGRLVVGNGIIVYNAGHWRFFVYNDQKVEADKEVNE